MTNKYLEKVATDYERAHEEDREYKPSRLERTLYVPLRMAGRGVVEAAAGGFAGRYLGKGVRHSISPRHIADFPADTKVFKHIENAAEDVGMRLGLIHGAFASARNQLKEAHEDFLKKYADPKTREQMIRDYGPEE